MRFKAIGFFIMSFKMKFTFLGTGTSQGIPVIGCKCPVCKSRDSRDKRLRSSLLIESKTTTVCIDAGPDFRQQMLRERVDKLDAIVFTHEHMDHTAGLDEIRAFNFIQGKPTKIYASKRVQLRLHEQFSYIFKNSNYPGIPSIKLIAITSRIFSTGDISFQPILLKHASMPVFGFKVGNFTYITDANYISKKEKSKINGSGYLVLNALRKKKHHSHFTLYEAVELSEELNARHTYFTHISHQMGNHSDVNKKLPPDRALAYDGLKIET